MSKSFFIDVLIITPVFYLSLWVAKSTIQEKIKSTYKPNWFTKFLSHEVGRPLLEFLFALWTTLVLIWLVSAAWGFG